MKIFSSARVSLAVILSLACLAAPTGFSFPIEPVSLRNLIIRSKLIVWAHVEAPEKPAKTAEEIFTFPGESSPAFLRPLTVYKGSLPPGHIEVHYEPNMICPAPPYFPVGKNVLAFLKPSEDPKGYATVALSYGAKNLSDEEALAYGERISAWLDLERLHGAQVPAEAITEWLVRCVETPVLKWEGAIEFADTPAFLETNIVQSAFAPLLTPAQRARISNEVFKVEYLDSADLDLFGLFEQTAKPAVVRRLKEYLGRASQPFPRAALVVPEGEAPGVPRTADADKFPNKWAVRPAMLRLANLLEDPDLQAYAQKVYIVHLRSEKERIRAVRDFLNLLEQTGSAGRTNK